MSKVFRNATARDIINDPQCDKESIPVFGRFLFYNELGILFGDTNSCKSILSVDIGISFTYGINFWNNPEMSKVLEGAECYYYDLEQSDRQFGRRYRNAPFSDDRFHRVSFPAFKYGMAGVDELIEVMKENMKRGVPNLQVLDNAQCILSHNFSPTKCKYMMQHLKLLKEINPDLTILLVAHTTKRNLCKELNQNSLAGSKVLANYADSIFAISESAVDSSLRYIKQIKSREVAKADEVALCEICEAPYLHLEFEEMACEKDHLKNTEAGRLSKVDDFMRARINALTSIGKSVRDIADELGLSKSHVHRIQSGQA